MGGVDGREDMRNDVDLGCAANSTARARSDGTTFSRGAPSGPEKIPGAWMEGRI